MIDNYFNDPLVIAMAVAGLVVVVTGAVMLIRVVRRVRKERHYDRQRLAACASVDALACAISYADLVIAHPDCDKTNYRDELTAARASFATLVRNKDLFDEQGAKVREWETMSEGAATRVEELRYLADAAKGYLHRVELARQAIAGAELKLASYTAPDGLTVDLAKVREGIELAHSLFGEYRFEDCRKVCGAIETAMEVCEEAALLDLALAEVSTKCGEGTWLAEAVDIARTARENRLRYFSHEYAEQTRDFFKATRIKLLSAVDDPEGDSLLRDED